VDTLCAHTVNHRLIMRMMPRIVGTIFLMMAIVRVDVTIFALQMGINLLTMGRITSIVVIVFRWNCAARAPVARQRAAAPRPCGWGALGGAAALHPTCRE
jgi:hypothetical protein